MVLRSERGPDGLRHLEARLSPDGDLVVEGQDLGRGVEMCFGEGNTEYEWAHTVRAAHLPALLEALGAAPGTDPLTVLAQRCSGPDAGAFSRLLAPTGPVPAEFWSRVGD
jgi:hypothetical protein